VEELMSLRAIVGAVILIIATGCGGAKSGGAGSADDADSPADGDQLPAAANQLEAGAAVCVENVVGIRYEIEDLLEERELKPVRDCMDADFQIAEEGQPGAFVMRYRKVGESDWQSCKSSSQDRAEFDQECLDAALGNLGGGSDGASAN